MESRTMLFQSHGGHGGRCKEAAVVRFWCLPGDRLSPRPGGDPLPQLPRGRGRPSIWLQSALNALTKATLGYLFPLDIYTCKSV